jgi:hypothetical protein
VKGFLEGYFSMHKPFVNVVQHLRDFGCFEMNKRDLSRQRQHILVAEEEILHEIGNHPRTRTSCKSFGSLSVCSLVYPKGPRFTSIQHPKSSGTKTGGFTFDVSFYAFSHNCSLFALLFKPLLFSE